MRVKNNLIKLLLPISIALFLVGCGFHLRGVDGTYQFPYKTVYLECVTPVICDSLRSTIKNENLTKLVTNKESAEAIIVVDHEQTNRTAYNFNSVGQIASYKLRYEVTAQVFNPQGLQTMPDIHAASQDIINYNNSLILSASQQEDQTWDNVHQNVIATLIRRIVYSHPYLASEASSESK